MVSLGSGRQAHFYISVVPQNNQSSRELAALVIDFYTKYHLFSNKSQNSIESFNLFVTTKAILLLASLYGIGICKLWAGPFQTFFLFIVVIFLSSHLKGSGNLNLLGKGHERSSSQTLDQGAFAVNDVEHHKRIY